MPVIEAMGMTETCSIVFCNPHDERRRFGSPGLPCGVTAKIVDDSGNAVPDLVSGEICLKGENVLHAYYKGEAETKKAFDAEGWMKTGDLGMRDADGFYFITGRLKELIIKGGENIAPREIDEVVLKHPAVLDAASVGIPDTNYGQEIMVCIILKEGQACSEPEMRQFCLDNLGKFRTPKLILFMDDLPRGPSGKVQRLKLLDLLQSK
jgi:long-chain acyl-CoA synthetase